MCLYPRFLRSRCKIGHLQAQASALASGSGDILRDVPASRFVARPKARSIEGRKGTLARFERAASQRMPT